MGVAHWYRVPTFAAALLEVLRRAPDLPAVDFVLLPMDVPGITRAGDPPLFAEARSRREPRDARQWLLPSFDTFRLEGGDVGDVAPAEKREASGAYWRGTVRLFYGYARDGQCGFQPLVWGVPTKIQNSLFRSNRSRFG